MQLGGRGSCFLKTALLVGGRNPTVLPSTHIEPAAGGWDELQSLAKVIIFLKRSGGLRISYKYREFRKTSALRKRGVI